jgi:hypothetical protein
LCAYAFCVGVAELADAQDLKSCGTYLPYRFDSGLRHQNRRITHNYNITRRKMSLTSIGGRVLIKFFRQWEYLLPRRKIVL